MSIINCQMVLIHFDLWVWLYVWLDFFPFETSTSMLQNPDFVAKRDHLPRDLLALPTAAVCAICEQSQQEGRCLLKAGYQTWWNIIWYLIFKEFQGQMRYCIAYLQINEWMNEWMIHSVAMILKIKSMMIMMVIQHNRWIMPEKSATYATWWDIWDVPTNHFAALAAINEPSDLESCVESLQRSFLMDFNQSVSSKIWWLRDYTLKLKMDTWKYVEIVPNHVVHSFVHSFIQGNPSPPKRPCPEVSIFRQDNCRNQFTTGYARTFAWDIVVEGTTQNNQSLKQ